MVTARFALPDGRTRPTDFIINSGFCLTSVGEFVEAILDALDDGQESMMFSIATHEDGHVVTGDPMAVSVTGAPTDTVHFAYRPSGSSEAFTCLGTAATEGDGGVSFTWDTQDLPDDDYEFVALYTEDEDMDEGVSVNRRLRRFRRSCDHPGRRLRNRQESARLAESSHRGVKGGPNWRRIPRRLRAVLAESWQTWGV